MESTQTKIDDFDPLSSSVSLAGEIYAATLKREIGNIIKSYTGWFDPFSELIQNALDAVDQRLEEGDDSYNPTIWIDIDLSKNLIAVTDNGIGFKRDEFMTFLRPSVSYKKPGRRGEKGVGATYLAYAFNFLQVGTKTKDFTWVGTLEGGRDWVDDENGVVVRPTLHKSEPAHEAFKSIDRGSSFCLRLSGKNVRPSDLKWFGATSADQWEVSLRVKTPLGGIYLSQDPPKTVCYLRVTKLDGTVESKTIQPCSYYFPHLAIPVCADLSEMTSIQQDYAKKGMGTKKLPDKYYKLNGVYCTWKHDEILSGDGTLRPKLNSGEEELTKKFKPTVYGFFTYSTSVWDEYNDEILMLRKGERVLRGGLQIAANGMPQGPLLVIPLTSNIGYQQTSHVIVHLELADPDLGRKGFQPELEALCEKLAVSAVGTLINWRTHLKTPTGSPRQIVQDKEIHEWVKQTEDHEKEAPIKISREDAFLPTKQISLTATPVVEQDVVALFNQLLAGGIIRGIRLMAASQYKQYDGLWKAQAIAPLENYVFDKLKNPLGLQKVGAAEYISAPYVLEYKFNFDGLIEEIEQGVKDEAAINLVVCWEMGEKWKKLYEVTSLLNYPNMHHRDIHGITHIVKDSSTGAPRFWVVVISELLGYINDPDGCQVDQRAKYGEGD